MILVRMDRGTTYLIDDGNRMQRESGVDVGTWCGDDAKEQIRKICAKKTNNLVRFAVHFVETDAITFFRNEMVDDLNSSLWFKEVSNCNAYSEFSIVSLFCQFADLVEEIIQQYAGHGIWVGGGGN
ncbi:MAG: hypothetical protein WC575_03405 [Patescibacteria group bacterium]